MDALAQVWITITSVLAIWFVSRTEKWKRWGYVFGMLSQPAWFYTMIKAEQWGIVALSCWYTYSWGQGIYNYWIKEV